MSPYKLSYTRTALVKLTRRPSMHGLNVQEIPGYVLIHLQNKKVRRRVHARILLLLYLVIFKQPPSDSYPRSAPTDIRDLHFTKNTVTAGRFRPVQLCQAFSLLTSLPPSRTSPACFLLHYCCDGGRRVLRCRTIFLSALPALQFLRQHKKAKSPAQQPTAGVATRHPSTVRDAGTRPRGLRVSEEDGVRTNPREATPALSPSFPPFHTDPSIEPTPASSRVPSSKTTDASS